MIMSSTIKPAFIFFILSNFYISLQAQSQLPLPICSNTALNITNTDGSRFRVNLTNSYNQNSDLIHSPQQLNNLYSVLNALSTNIDINYIYNVSVGESPDRINGIVRCRDDIQFDLCRRCVQNATVQVLQSCPNQKRTTIWFEFCVLRYSNESIFGSLMTSYWSVLSVWNTQNASSPNEFRRDLTTLLDDLRDQTSASLRKVAAGNRRSTSNNQTIYAMVKCSQDLSQDDCISCLISADIQLRISSTVTLGAGILFPSCSIRYEIYIFYNETRLRELLVSMPTSPQSSEHSPWSQTRSGNNTPQTIIILVISTCIGVIVIVGVGFLIIRRRIKQNTKESIAIVDDISLVEALQYDFDKIRTATNDFSDANKLGQGGFGAVYKGVLQNGQEIAVKRLCRNSDQGDLEFKNEVSLLARLQHRNLVRLLGFSKEGTEKLLVYDFVQNASLDYFLFDRTKCSQLDWESRYKIIGGIAKGILYLHEDSRLKIIHRDLKASNVLLDAEMNPKIADFGMARLFVQDEIQGKTKRIVGTYGYMAPEYAMYGRFSIKSDVFSFGVLVLEIISGQKNNSSRNGETVKGLLNCAWEYWRKGTTSSLIDPVLRVSSGIPPCILRCVHIGLLCVQENIRNRPTMAAVVNMINIFSVILPTPSQPAFFVPNEYDPEEVSIFRREFNTSQVAKFNCSSQNNVSITELHAR